MKLVPLWLACLLLLAGCVEERRSPDGYPSPAQPVPRGYTPIPGAAEKLEVIRRQEQLGQAIKQGDYREVDKLLEASPELINGRSKTGYTPFLLAVFHGNLDLAHVFVDKGAALDSVDPMGNDALLLAASGGSVTVVEFLESRGFQLTVRNSTGQSVLHQAALSGHSEVITHFLAQGVDPNLVDESGATPLHWAAAGNHLSSAKVLLSAGADPKVTTHIQNLTAVEHARLNGHQEMVDLLEAHMSGR